MGRGGVKVIVLNVCRVSGVRVETLGYERFAGK